MAAACKECGALKPLADYYASNKSRCKECVKTRVRANRKANAEYYKAYDRKRANQKERVDARAAYAKTVKGRMTAQRAKNEWADKNPHKKKANYAVGNALRDGKLTKGPCEVCGTAKRVQGHHDDYSKPLDVRWLCVTHHAEHHKREREEQRRQAA